MEIGADVGREDRLSKLDDGTLGHILSFLGSSKEAARAAALSSRWRDIFASVPTVSFEQPGFGDGGSDDDDRCGCPKRPRTFHLAVASALFARSRPTPAPPLRAFRLAMDRFMRSDGATVDQWVFYALRHAGAVLELDLTLHRILDYYTYRRYGACGYRARQEEAAAAAISQQAELDHAASEKERAEPDEKPPEPESDDDAASSADDDDAASSADDENESRKSLPLRSDTGYAVPRAVFSCAVLRSLRLAFCNLSCTPAMAISLPSLSALHLSNLLDDAGDPESLQRLVSACPRLADLTLEHCDMAGALSLLRNTRLRSLAVRCCHQLSNIAIDAPELRHFEYRGAAVLPPGGSSASFLSIRFGPDGCIPPSSVTSCKVATCGEEDEEEPGDLALHILQPFASTAERLHLSSAHMAGPAFARLPELPSLRSLHLNGRVTHDVSGLTAATSRVLSRAPGLETLTLFFEPKPHNRHTFEQEGDSSNFRFDDEGAYLDAHHLRYSQYDVLDAAPAAAVPACLRSTVRRIALVHYQGGRAQRTLARFLLRNAVVLEELYCGFAEGPLWVQTELMREMEGWVVSDKASKEFR